MKHWVVCYDITTKRAKTRRKLAKLLEGYGQRVQYSVFEIKLTEAEHDRVLDKIKLLLDSESDRFIMYPLTPTALEDSFYLGDVHQYEIPAVLVL